MKQKKLSVLAAGLLILSSLELNHVPPTPALSPPNQHLFPFRIIKIARLPSRKTYLLDKLSMLLKKIVIKNRTLNNSILELSIVSPYFGTKVKLDFEFPE